MLKGFLLRAKALRVSFQDRHNIHLMDDVMYKGKHCFANNGTTYSSDGVHLWDICEKAIEPDGKRNCYCVPDSELKRMRTWFNFKNDRLSLYKWYMKCWYNIDLNKEEDHLYLAK